MRSIHQNRIDQINAELELLPKESLTFKTIKGKKQPYLQWTEDGKTKSKYLKLEEREYVFSLIDKKEKLKEEKRRLLSYHRIVADILKRNPTLDQKPALGEQSFYLLRKTQSAYIDKTHFIGQWWRDPSSATLITRPRRFGKTLTLSMVECFFSTNYYFEEKGFPLRDMFHDLHIWQDEEMRELQGTIPTIFFSFAPVKTSDCDFSIDIICDSLCSLYRRNWYLYEDDVLNKEDKMLFKTTYDFLLRNDRLTAVKALHTLCRLKYLYHKKPVIMLIDEYDTPLIEAYQSPKDWEKMISFMRMLFNYTLKSNQYLIKSLITGITRIAKESLFSDMNQLAVSTVTSDHYADIFGFTRWEVEELLLCQNNDEIKKVKAWYDGYTFGHMREIYNPWSIMCYVSQREFRPYWINTASHGLIDRLLLKGGIHAKKEVEILLSGHCLHKKLDETIDFQNLETNEASLWSLLLATGYLRAEGISYGPEIECDLYLTNYEANCMLTSIVSKWFGRSYYHYSDFCQSLIKDDLEAMNYYLGEVAKTMISFFDTAAPSGNKAPENFYHGLVLGLIVELEKEYQITSNRESGFGRYDIMMKPLKSNLPSIIIEFKLLSPRTEKNLEETAHRALKQIEEKHYKEELLSQGIEENQIHSYGFAFHGKEVLILENSPTA
ncbi:MAG: ATP-binding protein [Dorea sp.]|nr:ATP-binding protein [Dorea sp.]